MQDLLHSIEDTFSIKVNGSRIYDEAETIEKPKPRNLKEPDDDIVGGWWQWAHVNVGGSESSSSSSS